jgi:hypothetical protein
VRNRSFWVGLFAATALAGGCSTLNSPVANAVPVRRLPDGVVSGPPVPAADAVGARTEPGRTRLAADRASAVVPASFEYSTAPGANSSSAVFYTGGALGSGVYPLRSDLRVVEAVAVAHGPLAQGGCCAAPGRATVLRRLPSGQQIAILVDLNEARSVPRENIPVWPGDTILTHETEGGSAGRTFGQLCRACVRAPVRLMTGCVP